MKKWTFVDFVEYFKSYTAAKYLLDALLRHNLDSPFLWDGIWDTTSCTIHDVQLAWEVAHRKEAQALYNPKDIIPRLDELN